LKGILLPINCSDVTTTDMGYGQVPFPKEN